MKKFVLLVVLVGLAHSSFGQKLIKTRMDSIAYDLAYTKYNIGRYHKEWKTGLIVASLGVVVSSAAVLVPPMETTKTQYVRVNVIVSEIPITTYNYTPMYIVIGIGAVTSAIGQIIMLDSHKWLKRASLKPSNYGVSFTYDLDKDFE